MNRPLVQTHLLAAAAGGVAIVLSAIGGFAGWDYAPQPFVWRDVALVCFLSALLLAATIAAVLLGYARLPHIAAIVSVELVVVITIPQLYIYARCRHDAARVAELVEESRFGEAQQLAKRVLKLRAATTWNGHSLKEAVIRIDAIVDNLQRRVADDLPNDASGEDRLGRAGDLAMLGQTAAAIAVLDSPMLGKSPEGFNLRGTIHETRSEWQIARDWYARAKPTWQSRDGSPESATGLTHAVRGIAYCERKLGHLPQAEAAYQELLALAPTADMHFLVAQFYEDTQQATKAQTHARQAMALDPQRYTLRGGKLIAKLITLHFGCWGAFAAERGSTSSGGAQP